MLACISVHMASSLWENFVKMNWRWGLHSRRTIDEGGNPTQKQSKASPVLAHNKFSLMNVLVFVCIHPSPSNEEGMKRKTWKTKQKFLSLNWRHQEKKLGKHRNVRRKWCHNEVLYSHMSPCPLELYHERVLYSPMSMIKEFFTCPSLMYSRIINVIACMFRHT
mgnify:CR=1 FL=1